MPGVNSELAKSCDFTMACHVCHVMIYILQPANPFLWDSLVAIVHSETCDFARFCSVSCYVVMLLRGNTRLEVVICLGADCSHKPEDLHIHYCL